MTGPQPWIPPLEGRGVIATRQSRLGWWATVAMCLSVLLHVAVFFLLDRMKIAFQFEAAQELSTRQVDLRQVQVPADEYETLPPEETLPPPTKDSAKLLDEIDVLDKIPTQNIDIKPDIDDAVFALSNKNPAKEGVPAAMELEISTGIDMADLPEMGRSLESIRPSAIGQLTVDPGKIDADDGALGKFTDNLVKQGANGQVEKGTLDGLATLDSMLSLPKNILLGTKTLLPSDLLFEFNSSDLRESAKVGLMKLGLLMDQHPDLFCWIEGHTDLVGGDEFNNALSLKRAEAVKFYLVKALRMDFAKIKTRGFGRSMPLIVSGTPEQQAMNRRVEIRMRSTPPPAETKAEPVIKAIPVPEPPRVEAVLIKPKRVPTTQELAPPPSQEIPKAIPRAEAAEPEVSEPEPPRAVPRAEAVE